MRIILVSNRLPMTIRVEEGRIEAAPSPGGLATGLRGPHEKSGGLWVGWPGNLSGLSPEQRDLLDQRLGEQHTVPVHLSDEEEARYYQGFANGVLWPLFHYLLDKVALESRDFDVYRSVNERFADAVAAHYQPGDMIWVHDYQLMLLPTMLRERLPEARIGFFLHIPFPSSEVFRILPWRHEILEGLLGADLIGFHTLTYMRHCAGSLLRILGVESQVDHLNYQGRRVCLGAFPMGVDADEFRNTAESPECLAAAAAIRAESGGRRIFLGVDRLDYTKGIPRRLLAFERLLERRPDIRDTARFIQVAVPSRAGIGPYEELRRQVDEMLGNINGRFGTAGAVPVHHLYRSFDQKELAALYRAADVMLVTPLRDGMNLVAKEYCACRTDDDGVLILSEFAGASAELGEAIRVNPYDIEQLSRAYEQALDMGAEERQARMRALRERVGENNVHRWARSFLDALEQLTGTGPTAPMVFTSKAVVNEIVEAARSARALDLFLDYDGTLMPFTSTPDLAAPDDDVRELLRSLAAREGTRVHMLSGRRRGDLERWFGDLGIGLYAEHGLWLRPPGQDWTMLTEPVAKWKDKVRPIMEVFENRVPGSFIEEKTAALVWHYRDAEPEFALEQARELRLDLMAVLSNVPVEVLQGERIVEVRMHGVHKGAVVQRILSERPGGVAVALGDDRTDEDMFAALPPDGYAIHVGAQPSRARYNLRNAAAARAFLRRLLRSETTMPAGATDAHRVPATSLHSSSRGEPLGEARLLL